ncbi:MAG: anaerobic sulfatase maturase [Acidobacteriia bacterium]|nr:anaerobic sulfatase maturase [Terriglobia bacterium]
MGIASNPFPLYVGSGNSLDLGLGPTPRISSLLIKPASAVCNLDCAYCFYLDRDADPYKALPARAMTLDTLERLVDTYLFYSYPSGVFAFQGGEPTLAGLPFFEKLVEFQKRYGRDGQTVSNALQTNAILLDQHWCDLFRSYQWLLGVSLDGPEEVNDRYRFNKQGRGTWKRVVQSVELLQRNQVEFNILCVLSQANVDRPKELYRFYRSLGIDNLQFIPLAEFDQDGNPLPFTISPEQYGRFLCEVFDLWWPDRRKVRIRFFDNIAEALAGQKPGTCTMHETCDSYVVVEYNGDVYPCDFFVEQSWKLGNIVVDSWPEIARRTRRYSFASKKTLAHPECQACEYQSICHGGCPKLRHAAHARFEDLDYFCQAYKMIYARSTAPLRADLAKMQRGAGFHPAAGL